MNNLNKNKLIYFTDKVKSLENAILNQAKILTDITEILDEEIAVNKNSSCVYLAKKLLKKIEQQ
tara:strand:- start:1207 stop:1398 length:192 start_codon:yes stop_codon:yes gene_type:complete